LRNRSSGVPFPFPTPHAMKTCRKTQATCFWLLTYWLVQEKTRFGVPNVMNSSRLGKKSRWSGNRLTIAKCHFNYETNKMLKFFYYYEYSEDRSETQQILINTNIREKKIGSQNTWTGTLTRSIKLSRRPTFESTACCRLFFQRSMFDSFVNMTWQHHTTWFCINKLCVYLSWNKVHRSKRRVSDGNKTRT
jgi:hypothetical protein